MSASPSGPGVSVPHWDTFSVRGRAFVRMTLPDSTQPLASLSVASSVAGRYRVENLLACGEATVLLRAFDTRTARPVVLKAVRTDRLLGGPDGAEDCDEWTAAIRRARHVLQTERRLLVRLRNSGCHVVPAPLDYVYDWNPDYEEPSIGPGRHPVARVIDPFLAATEPYLVLPYLSGESMEEALARHYPRGMDERQALRGILPVVRALALIHRPWRLQSGRTWHCIYQDLKPANLMVEPDGSLKLIDLGGCQVVVDGVPVLEGSFTPGYAPPECVARGPARVLLACADVYTVGSTLYHMVTGIDPRPRTPGGPERDIGRFDPGALPAGTSPGLEHLLRACLARRPSERIADAGLVAEAIQSLLDEDAGRTGQRAPGGVL